MLIDPEMDGQGLPNNAGIVGDFLATRQLFSLSYPINAANSDISGSVLSGRGGASASLYPSNFEYPGNAHVLTAPAINGFDLSAWAQIPSGKHRIMFIVRPQNNTPFKNLSALIRGNILIDTTVELAHGEVYTMQRCWRATWMRRNTDCTCVRKALCMKRSTRTRSMRAL